MPLSAAAALTERGQAQHNTLPCTHKTCAALGLQISVVQAHDDAAGIAGGFEMVRLLKVCVTALLSYPSKPLFTGFSLARQCKRML